MKRIGMRRLGKQDGMQEIGIAQSRMWDRVSTLSHALKLDNPSVPISIG